MLTEIRPWHRSTAPMSRVIAALPHLPLPHTKRHRRMSAGAIVRPLAGLMVLLIGTAAVVMRDKLASIVSRGDAGEKQAPDAAEE
ncbi:MAG: hypothetical protein QOH43_396 [Solirubrobacteraceae bacterium]|jgi:hypothetical protein|nr:hypothetical protein [Solirubrobacteraceae bacterium]